MLMGDWLARKLMGGRVPRPQLPESAGSTPAVSRTERLRTSRERAEASAPLWRFVSGPADGITVQARSRSEARARAKEALGLKRLPAGTRCKMVMKG